MLAKILYEQAHPIEGKEIRCGASEMVVMHLARAFPGKADLNDKSPMWELDKTHLDTLKGMESTWVDVSENPYTQIIRAIKQLGSVRLWIEW